MNQARHVILHIGCEKTGTTAIQEALAYNRDTLLQHGILFPTSPGNSNHTRLAIYCADENRNLCRFLPGSQSIEQFRREFESDLHAEISASDAESIVFSSEWLHPRCRSRSEFDRLNRLLGGIAASFEVICYVRQQDAMCRSLYSTSLKAGNHREFSYPDIDGAKSLPYYYDFHALAENWQRNSEAKNITVRWFDKLAGGDVVADFFDFLGIEDGVARQGEKRPNPSLDNNGILIARAVNFAIHEGELELSATERKQLIDEITARFHGKPELSTAEHDADFLAAFDASNERLQRQFGTG